MGITSFNRARRLQIEKSKAKLAQPEAAPEVKAPVEVEEVKESKKKSKG